MQALRSLFTRTPAAQPAPAPVKPPVALEPHELPQVAGGIPRIGGGFASDTSALAAEPLPRIGG
jgi:hypothetical protein